MHNDTDSLPRRDSRKARIARNRLHPDHNAVLAEMLGTSRVGPSLWPGPNGLTRRNPHLVGFSSPNGIKRIDRSGARRMRALTCELNARQWWVTRAHPL